MRALLLAAAFAIATLAGGAEARREPAWTPAEVAVEELPREARETLQLIRKKGPFPHARDGVVFGNREGLLPKQPRGYYREFTVRTPGERTRGARRIVTGQRGELWYTEDHYNSFRRDPGVGFAMALEALRELLEAGKGGVYFIPPTPAKSVQSAAKAAAMRCFHIEGKSIERKEQMLNAVATALQLPAHFGHNWDALEEGLIDIDDDADGYVLYYDHIDPLVAAHPDQFQTFVEVCRDAVATWKADDKTMVVLCSGSKAPKGLPRLK